MQKFFADSVWLQDHWYVPYLVVPVAALLALAWPALVSSGPRARAGPMPPALLITAFLVYLTVGAAYSCWHYCF